MEFNALVFLLLCFDLLQFGASVGSGVLTLRQSVVLAFVMEIVGASLLGNHSIDAVDSFVSSCLWNITDLNY